MLNPWLNRREAAVRVLKSVYVVIRSWSADITKSVSAHAFILTLVMDTSSQTFSKFQT